VFDHYTNDREMDWKEREKDILSLLEYIPLLVEEQARVVLFQTYTRKRIYSEEDYVLIDRQDQPK
jgi:hypothetical protein